MLSIKAKYQFGQASNHLDFIRNDVIAYVESHYRTDPNNRTYFGYSLGGVFGAYVLLTQPETFKNYILGSAALNGDIPYFTELASKTAQKNSHLNANVFISYGNLEVEASEHIEKFITLLKNKNDKTLSVLPIIIEGNHQTAFPRTGVRSVAWLANLIKNNEQ
ncbi:alpha/beta hydrolase-fold protein [uncultured Dokdonia sp.]|uniref:alpha/beta hydrolase n=1 Tax=uncultured Dokdonia sp. TaxID=575653 RepID=UPI00260F464F|nr:alpha/beta hydrolase-fold protein [uncultured Dokdonia sp.]